MICLTTTSFVIYFTTIHIIDGTVNLSQSCLQLNQMAASSSKKHASYTGLILSKLGSTTCGVMVMITL